MKKRLLTFIQKILYSIAVFSVATPSQLGTYQAKCPESLKKYHI